ncbi:TDT family transporter [Rhodococcus sp. BP22]|uniref:TDT family transporter n=1 Tax=Rhodococcus sp. BP22 TaxID=2758566 RepID=UPI0016443D80|nr:TDT family transporter [Rhodococcus sp. BP22]
MTTPATLISARPRLFDNLDRPGQVLEHLGPNWFASIMGTGIVANAAATLPVQVTGLHTFALIVWAIASAALIALVAAFAAHWILHGGNARRYARHPVASLFYGAPPMAFLTVGAGTLLVGKDVLGHSAALSIDVVLWTAGTLMGLATTVWIPWRMIAARAHAAPLPAWLMPVVPPMVSASTGVFLLQHMEGRPRLVLLVACYAMFALSLTVGMFTMALIGRHLLRGGTPPLQAMPTVWICLGLIGQSITAANLLGAVSARVFSGDDAAIASGLHVFGIVYGIVMAVFGALVFATAMALTVRAASQGLTFSLTWWSFTFPVGTCVTGAAALGTATNSTGLHLLAVALFVLLVTAWAVVATNTVRGSVSGRIFLPA